MKQDRFLIGILIGIGLLIIIALAVFFTRQDTQTYVSEAAPEGVVHNYVLAVLNQDYQKAYGYLADLNDKPTFAEFRQSFAVGRISPSEMGLRVGKANVIGDAASVEVDMVNAPGGLFSSGYDNTGLAQLVRQNGAWKISSMPVYTMWDYMWYQAPPAKP